MKKLNYIIISFLLICPIYYLYHVYLGDVRVKKSITIESKSVVVDRVESFYVAKLSDGSSIVIPEKLYEADNIGVESFIYEDNEELFTSALVFGMIELILGSVFIILSIMFYIFNYKSKKVSDEKNSD